MRKQLFQVIQRKLLLATNSVTTLTDTKLRFFRQTKLKSLTKTSSY